MPHLFLIRPGTLFHHQKHYVRRNKAGRVYKITAIPSPDMHCQNTVGQLIVGVHWTHRRHISAAQNLPQGCHIWTQHNHRLHSSCTFQSCLSAQQAWNSKITTVMGKQISDAICSFCIRPSQMKNLPAFGLLWDCWSQFNWFRCGTVCSAEANNAWGTQDSLLCLLVAQRVLCSCSVAFLFHAGWSS